MALGECTGFLLLLFGPLELSDVFLGCEAGSYLDLLASSANTCGVGVIRSRRVKEERTRDLRPIWTFRLGDDAFKGTWVDGDAGWRSLRIQSWFGHGLVGGGGGGGEGG